jgi:hypothetical protein
MKKLIITVLVSTFVFGLVGLAQATYTETFLGTPSDGTSVTVNKNNTYYFYFDLTSAGLANSYYLVNNTGTKTGILIASDDAYGFPTSSNTTVSSAILSYTFNDNDPKVEVAKVLTGPSDGNKSHTYQLNLQNATETDSFPIDISTYVIDGKLLAIFSALKDSSQNDTNFKLEQVKLTVDTQTTTVPLPAAGLLLGSGLIGLICVRRKQTI